MAAAAGEWQQERVDLSGYAGQVVWVQMVWVGAVPTTDGRGGGELVGGRGERDGGGEHTAADHHARMPIIEPTAAPTYTPQPTETPTVEPTPDDRAAAIQRRVTRHGGHGHGFRCQRSELAPE
ncbi:MAG: hypothetical protein U0703_11890 [Anaerolineae bacterium]